MSRKHRSLLVPVSPDLRPLDSTGWMAVPGVLSPAEARALAGDCSTVLAGLDQDLRVGDKKVGGTRRLAELVERVPAVEPVPEHPGVPAAVAWFLGEDARLGGVTFRNPQPGFGEQRFHARRRA